MFKLAHAAHRADVPWTPISMRATIWFGFWICRLGTQFATLATVSILGRPKYNSLIAVGMSIA
jgi:hypothetical protein